MPKWFDRESAVRVGCKNNGGYDKTDLRKIIPWLSAHHMYILVNTYFTQFSVSLIVFILWSFTYKFKIVNNTMIPSIGTEYL